MKGDYFRYLAEVATPEQRGDIVGNAQKAYEVGHGRKGGGGRVATGDAHGSLRRTVNLTPTSLSLPSPRCRTPSTSANRRWPRPTPSAWAWRSTSPSSTTRSSTPPNAPASSPSRRLTTPLQS